MSNVIEIKENDFVKYAKSVYLIKSSENLNSGRCILNYYFRAIRGGTRLHINGENEVYSDLTKNIKKASEDEMNFLISIIKEQYPDFDLSFVKNKVLQNEVALNEEDCINFLKNKGYIVCKQV